MKLSVMFQPYLFHFNILRVQGKNPGEDYPQGNLNFSKPTKFRQPCRHVCIYECMHFSSQVRFLKFMCMQHTQRRELQRLHVQSTNICMLMTELMANNNQVLVTLSLEL